MDYCELHLHASFSLLDGASAPEDLMARAREIGLPALAITDHDNLYAASTFWREARSAGIKPFIGAEVTVSEAPPCGTDDKNPGTQARDGTEGATTSPCWPATTPAMPTSAACSPAPTWRGQGAGPTWNSPNCVSSHKGFPAFPGASRAASLFSSWPDRTKKPGTGPGSCWTIFGANFWIEL